MTSLPYAITKGPEAESLAYDIACRQADLIRHYWFSRGFPVEAWPTSQPGLVKDGGHILWGIASDLRNGLPQGASATAVHSVSRGRG